jgi:hypothetical protein
MTRSAGFASSDGFSQKVTQELTVRLRFAVLAVACSAAIVMSIGIQTSAGVTVPTKTVTPKKWVHSVCTSLTDWQNQIQPGQNLASSVQSATDLAQVKDQVVSYLQSTVDATDQLVTSLGKAGTASVKNGNKISKEFKKGFNQIRDVFVAARDSTQSLDISDPTQFGSSLTNIGSDIDNGANTIKSTFDSVDRKYHPVALDRAFNSDPACASLRG